MELAFVRLLKEPGAQDHELIDLAGVAIPTFEALNDDRALGRAWLLTAFVHGGRHLRCKAREEAAERALFHYRRAGWPAATCLGQLANALYQGPTVVTAAALRCEALLANVAQGPADEANVLVFLGGLKAMHGRLDEGRALVAKARAMFDELGQLGLIGALCGEVHGAIECLAGEFRAAEHVLRESCELLERANLRSTFATRAGELAAAVYAQGRFTEAADWVRAAEGAASADDLDARLAWQPVHAKLLARRGEHERAQRLARDAVSAVLATDASSQRARVFLDLAAVLTLAGREGEAATWVEQARRTHEEKGNVAGAAQVSVAAVA